jgi:hypothetical protein
MERLAPRAVLCLAALLFSGCAPYFANLAKDFGGTLAGPGADMRPMIRTVGTLCRRQADLMYLRARLEDPTDKAIIAWRDRRTALYSGRTAGIEERCAELDSELLSYQLMFDALLSYGSALRALADTQNVDFRDGFLVMGDSLGKLAMRVRPRDPELVPLMISGADSVNQLLRLALSARSERDIKRAILAAKVPVGALLDRLQRVIDVYRDQVTHYSDAQKALLDKIERATQPPRPGAPARHLDVLAFYDLAQRIDEEEQRLVTSSKVYLVTLGNIRGAHEVLVKAAEGRVPLKDAVASVQKSLRELSLRLGEIYDQSYMMIRRGMQ